jgi:photosystem II stability/assembly factor-like uncharacterized protein
MAATLRAFFIALVMLVILTGQGLAQWTLTSAPVTNINGIVTDGSKIFVAQKDSGIFLSTDDGDTWQPRNNNLYYGSLSGISILNDTIFTYGGGAIYKMHVNDTTWSDPITQGTNSLLVSDSYYLSSYNLAPAIFISNDYGATWVLSTINNAPSGQLFTKFLDTGTSLLAGHSQGIYRSTDNGVSWDIVNLGFPSPLVSTFLNHASGIYAAGVYNVHPMLLRSTDDGITWVDVQPAGFTSGGISSLANSGSVFYCSVKGAGGGVYFSIDNGISWTVSNTGIVSPSFANNLLVKGTNAFVSANGLWKSSLSQITSVNDNNIGEIPETFSLAQNYPNPFNPSTTIRYTIPSVTLSGVEGTRVQLKVYDVLGNEVATLVNEEKPAGSYKVNWNASNLSSGIYFYRIHTGSFVSTKKMILIK